MLCQLVLWQKCYVKNVVSIFAAFSLLCCIGKIIIYAQDYMWHWQNYMWHWRIHLLTFAFELFLDMTLAWDPTFIKCPMS